MKKLRQIALRSILIISFFGFCTVGLAAEKKKKLMNHRFLKNLLMLIFPQKKIGTL
ncbi:MAG: hypothetical protein HZB80_05335 [Deltaproteobacteria bacterium]|nr:hypothetical protein [Deltaproteobacteria bacterium]